MINEFASLRRAIDEKAIVPVPSGKLDDAKKGEGKMSEGKVSEAKREGKKGEEEEVEKASGKDVVVYQEKPKLLASSMAVVARSSTHVAAQIEADAVLATTLQMQQAFELMETGVTVISQVQPLQKMPAQAAPSSSTQALALTAPPPAEKKKVTPPPPKPQSAPVKTQPKRAAAPIEKEEDPKAKRQKIQKNITAKNTRLEEKKKEEEERRKEAERQETLRIARIRKVEERAAKLWDENRLIQSCLVRSAYISFTPDESEVCAIQADIDACRVTIKEMVDSGRYTPDEFDLIRKFINQRAPTFNSGQSKKFHRVMKEMTERSSEEIEVRRGNHPDACEIENFISDKLKDAWSKYREKFIKAYYFWQVVPGQEFVSNLDALNNFMVLCYEPLRRKIFVEPKKKIISPSRLSFLCPQCRIQMFQTEKSLMLRLTKPWK